MCVTRRIIFLTVLLLAGCSSLPVSGSASDSSPPPATTLDVSIESGTVRGLLAQTFFRSAPYYAFKGLPYAQPPLGAEGRFKLPRPLPAGAWNGTVRECFQHGPMCLQTNGAGVIVGSEDCLTLNVYVPANATTTPADYPSASGLPVMVYLHGGAFYTSSANSASYGPDFLIEQSVVLVTVQFRLGVLGLLAVDEDAANTSGNWQFKDQQLALRWVQRNIGAFGGDAGRVTLFGTSSGSTAIQLHQLAPGSRGLFHRTIEMSQTFDRPEVFRPRSPQLTGQLEQLVADELSIDVRGNVVELMTALRSLNASAFLQRFPYVQFKSVIMPTIESSLATDPFIQGDPAYFAMEQPFDIDIPVITGCGSNEAILISTQAGLAGFRQRQLIDIPSIHFDGEYTSDKYLEARSRIFERYLGDANGAPNATLAEYGRLYSDVYEGYVLDRKLRALARRNRSPTWAYEFDLDTALNAIKRTAETPEARALPGAAHVDDWCYVFYCGGAFPQMYANAVAPDSVERQLVERLTGIYGRFAWGVEPEWAAVPAGWEADTPYLHMGMDGFEQKYNAMGEGRQFWDGIVEEFGYVAL